MSLEGISQQAAVTCGSRFCNLFQNRYVAGSTLVISAVVSFLGMAILIAEIKEKLPSGELRAYLKEHPFTTGLFPAAVGTIAVSILLAKVLRLPMSQKPVVGIPVAVSVIIITLLYANR